MAAITFHTAHRKLPVQEQFQTVAALREMPDAFVGNRMRRAAAEAEHVRPLGTPSPSTRAR